MAQQTAVEWLIEQLRQLAHNPETRGQEWGEAFEQAKQMEKEHIVEAFYEGMKTNPFDPNRGRGTMYYNETYKKQ